MKKIRVLFLVLHFCLRSAATKSAHTKARLLHLTAIQLVQILGIQVTVKRLHSKAPSPLWIANHTGFWDIIFLSSIQPLRFITSQEMRETPFLGRVCRIAGCFFMNRKDPHRLRSELKALKLALDLGLPLVLFPEGTTSDGRSISEFKRGVLQFIKEPIKPWVISYLQADGHPFTRKEADSLFYFGDHSFFGQALNIFKQKKLEVVIEEVDVSDVNAKLDQALRHAMLEKYRPPKES